MPKPISYKTQNVITPYVSVLFLLFLGLVTSYQELMSQHLFGKNDVMFQVTPYLLM